MPCWLTRTRWIERRRSPLLSQLAFVWLSGMMNKKTIPIAMVRKPATRKMIFQGSIAEPCFSIAVMIPYEITPPAICATPFALNQIAVRVPCSSLVYHCDVRRAKPGVTDDSNNPRKNRSAKAPEMLRTAAKQQRMVPHAMILKARYLPRGKYCSSLCLTS